MFLVQMQGNAVDAPTSGTNKAGKEFARFTVAATTRKDDTQFVTAFVNGGLKDVVSQYVGKGRSVFVTGRPALNPRKSDNGEVFANVALSVDQLSLQGDKGGSRGLMLATVIGRVVADPEAKMSESGTEFRTIRVAVDVGYGDKKTTQFVNVVVFNGLIQVADYLEKGQSVTVAGPLSARAFERKNGEAGAEFSIRASEIVLGPKARGTEEEQAEAPAPVAAGEEYDDEIPF